MKRYVISKYLDNKFHANDWTDYSDIGLIFNDKILTMETYMHTENKYIDAINQILFKLKIDSLYIKDYTENNLKDKRKDGILLGIDESNKIMREILRNQITHCVFYYPHKFRLTFGFDYYMYISCNIKSEPLARLLKQYDLYCSN